MHVIGKTGSGKSTLIKNLIIQDIQQGHGVAVVDPHGDLVDEILTYIPSLRTHDVVYFNPADFDFPVNFNILEQVSRLERALVASHVISIFKNTWHDSWGPRLEYILANAVRALLDYQGSTLLWIPRLLVDDTFRKKVIDSIHDPMVKQFWLTEYERYPEHFRQEVIAPILNKVGQFLMHELVRNVVGPGKHKIEMGFMMDKQH